MIWTRGIRTSPIRPAWFFMTPLARVLVAMSARLGRRIWKGWAPERRQAVKTAIRQRSHYILGGLGVGSLCCLGYYYHHIEEVPITQRKRFMMLSRQKIIQLMEEEKEELLHEVCQDCPILPSDDPSYALVFSILKRIIPMLHSHWSEDMKELKWTVHILDSPKIANAICLPSGDIFIYSGLFGVCHNEDELAFILSHEIAHVLLNHGGETLSNQGLINFFHLFVVGALWALIPSDLVSFFLHKWTHSLAHILFHLPYSRVLEEEADKVGYLLASSACFEPSKSAQIWSHFPSEKDIPEYLSTHPLNESRLEALKSLYPTAEKVWKESECHSLQLEVTNFNKLVNKTLKKLFFK